jgi:DNA mismatch repair protein MutS2
VARDQGELACFLSAIELDAVRGQVAARAASDPGRALALALAPHESLEEALAAQGRTRDAHALLATSGLTLDLGGVPNVAAIFDRAARGERPLDPRELVLLARCTRAAEQAAAVLAGSGPGLRDLLAGVDLERLQAFAALVEATFDHDLEVRDDAAPDLKSLREAMHGARAALEEALVAIAADPAIASALFQRRPVDWNGQLCLAVKGREAARVPGTLLDREPAGETIYVEPLAARDLANRALELVLEERARVEAILLARHEAAKERAHELADVGRRLALLDLHLALGRFARDLDMTPPRLVAEGALLLLGVRHPVLAERGACVPIDVALDGDRRLLVISGPNGGGKTVAMKTTGIACVLALAGAFVPAREGSQVPVFGELLAAAVEGDDLERGLSTFEAHARRLASVSRRASPNALVLLDEVGLGTDPIEGAALGRAILEHLLALGARTLATTHLGPIKAFASATAGALNASVEVDASGKPLYRLVVGKTGESSALLVARRAGVPEAIVARAERILTGRPGASAP